MPRILGVDIPNDKHTLISLQYIYGVGAHLAGELCQACTGHRPDRAQGEIYQTTTPGWAGLAL